MLRFDNPWNNEDQPVTLEEHTAAGVTTTEFPALFQFSEQLRHMAGCLTTGQPHRIPPENSVNQMRVIDAVFEAIRTGQVVTLHPAGASLPAGPAVSNGHAKSATTVAAG